MKTISSVVVNYIKKKPFFIAPRILPFFKPQILNAKKNKLPAKNCWHSLYIQFKGFTSNTLI